MDVSLNNYALDASLSIYVTKDSLDVSLNNYALDASLINLITRSQLDASFQNINTNISDELITRSQLDASFQNINTNISGNFVNEASFNDLKNRSDNFFFFFKLKPWSLVYKNGNYSYPIGNYGNNFSYNFGDFSNSYIDNFASSSSNLQLFWKIPPRIFLNSTLNNTNIDFLPIYDNLIIEYKEENSNIWKEIVNISNFPDPSNNSGYNGYNNKNDLSMVFILDLTRNTANVNDNYNTTITDLSFEINYIGGYTNFQNSKAYQFRVYLTNSSDLSNNFDKKNDQYDYDDISINYLYFPDLSNVYFLTASRGNPKAPTNIIFSNVDFDSVIINMQLNSTTADINNIISIPIPVNDNDNKLVFTLDLIATKNINYKKFIPFNNDNYTISNISNNIPSTLSQINLIQTNNIEPEFSYNISNYGMYFANDSSNISYASINQIFITPPPLRNEVNSNFNLYLNNYTLFNSNLRTYNSNLNFLSVTWRETNQIINFYFYNDSNSLFNMNLNNLNNKLFNSLKSINFSNLNSLNEPKGIELSNNNLCSFIMYSQKIKNSVETNIYNPFTIDTSFNDFLTTSINSSNNNYTFKCMSQDILPNGENSVNDYSNKNGYYVGLVLNDISYNIDLNDFFDVTTDLCFNNISLKTKITQEFDNLSYNKEEEYLIYKITNDLTQNITLDSSSSSFDLTYNETNEGTYFGLTSIKPHNSKIDLVFSGLLNNLSKYIRSNNNILVTLNLKVSGSLTSSNVNNINWESNNNNSQNINHSYNFNPLSNLNLVYGTYEGNYILNGSCDITINNNIFSQNSVINHNNLVLGPAIDISNKYFWDITRIGTNNIYFKDTNMIVFDNNPLNDNYNQFSGLIFDPYNSSSYIKYNQSLYRNINNSGLFYSENNFSIYKNYTIYKDNSNINLDYSIYNISGDNLNYNINNYFLNGNLNNVNNRYKWICFDIDLTGSPPSSDNITLQVQDLNNTNIGNDIIFYIKLKYNNYFNQIVNENITYSSWLDCQAILENDPNNVSITNKAGVYSNNSPFGTYPLPLELPNLSSNATNLILLVGITNNYNLNINNLNITFN